MAPGCPLQTARAVPGRLRHDVVKLFQVRLRILSAGACVLTGLKGRCQSAVAAQIVDACFQLTHGGVCVAVAGRAESCMLYERRSISGGGGFGSCSLYW